MSKKNSLAAALQSFDRSPTTPPTQEVASSTQNIREKRDQAVRKASAPQAPPSRAGKKALIGYFDPGVSKQLKQMALDEDRTVQHLLAEALNDFFQKHKKPTIA